MQEVKETSRRQRDPLSQETAAAGKKQPTEQEQADSLGPERMAYPDTVFPGQTDGSEAHKIVKKQTTTE